MAERPTTIIVATTVLGAISGVLSMGTALVCGWLWGHGNISGLTALLLSIPATFVADLFFVAAIKMNEDTIDGTNDG